MRAPAFSYSRCFQPRQSRARADTSACRARPAGTRPLLLPALSCILLATGMTLSRADDTVPPATLPAANTPATLAAVQTAAAKAANTTPADKATDNMADAHPTSAVTPDTASTDRTPQFLKPRSLRGLLRITRPALRLTGLLSGQDAPQSAPAQSNPPRTSTPPQKPSEGQPGQTTTAPTAVTPAAPTPPGTITYSGLIDVYYGINARAPHTAGPSPFGGHSFTGYITPSGERFGVDNAGRSFDVNDWEFSFSLGEFNITRTEGRGIPLGFTATLTTGDTARLVHITEPGGTSAWQNIQQAFVTKTVKVAKRDVTVDAGIFITPIGSRFAVAERVKQFDDNAGGLGLRTGGVGYNRLREGTVTLEYTLLRSHLVTRVEYRHDASNQSFFGAGSSAVRDQDTAIASAAYKF